MVDRPIICDECGLELVKVGIPSDNALVHRFSRSTRCCNEEVYRTEYKHELPIAKVVPKKSWVQSVFLFWCKS